MSVKTYAPPPVDMPSEALFLRNMEKLAAVAPDIHARMADIKAVAGRVVQDADDAGDINFVVDGRQFYGSGLGARAHARREVEKYLTAPQQLSWAPLTEPESAIANLMRERVDAFAQSRGLRPGGQPGHHRAAVLVMFGLGLGEPLRLLLGALEFRHVIVVEPIAEFIWHSLWLQDWAGWLDLLAARGGTLRVTSDDDAEIMSTIAHQHLLATGAIFDGTYCYGHYSSSALDNTVKRFYDRVNSITGEGFFEDELIMTINSTRNLTRRPVRLITNHRATEKTVPAMIIGAGPSLAAALPHIAANREGAIVFSAGTTLGSLLRYGIVPDFHCEIENSEENFDALAPVAAAHDLSGITLIASATVDPRMPDLFGGSLLYLRDQGMSACLYADAMTAIDGTPPNCMTLATRMISRFGLREVYLFGTDFGSRRPELHHVADSIWMTDPVWREKYDRSVEAMNMPMPANFGGKAYSNKLLEYFLHSAQRLIKNASDVTFFNCSDGVRIAGAAPRLPAQVAVRATRQQRLAAFAKICEATEPHAPGDLIDQPRAAQFRRLFAQWIHDLLDDLARIGRDGGDLIDIHDAIYGSIDRFGQGAPAVGIRIMAWGSLAMMFRHAFHYAVRHQLIADAGLMGVVLAGFRASLLEMRRQFDAVFKAEFDV